MTELMFEFCGELVYSFSHSYLKYDIIKPAFQSFGKMQRVKHLNNFSYMYFKILSRLPTHVVGMHLILANQRIKEISIHIYANTSIKSS